MSSRRHVKIENWYDVAVGRLGKPHKGPLCVVNGQEILTHIKGEPRTVLTTKAGYVDGFFIEADGSLTPSYVEQPQA